MNKKKSWEERLNSGKQHQIKIIDKKFADMPAGSKMLISTPEIINEYIMSIPYGNTTEIPKIRKDLAKKYKADKTCPVTTGIFLRIAAEAAYEQFENGSDIKDIAPFWRAIDTKAKMAQKLACGLEFIEKQRSSEGIYTQF